MPDVRKIEYTLLRKVKLNWTNVKLDGCNQGYRGQQYEIGYYKDLARTVIPKLYEFYL
jgi:hypothetical protein